MSPSPQIGPPPPAAAARWHVGVAGWDYADWVGPVYPARSSRQFDRLGFLARYVDCVEVNATFYRHISAVSAEGWLRRVDEYPAFRFTAKCHQSWTHGENDELADAVGACLAGLRPLLQAGRLGALLLQFPQRAHDRVATRDRIERLVELCPGWPLAIELRHRGWGRPAAQSWLDGLGLTWCIVDQPQVGSSTLGWLPRRHGSRTYVRLHGRNAATWFQPDAGRDARYDYRYRADEIAALHADTAELLAPGGEAYVIQNNHFRGQALADALQWKALIERQPIEAPEDLVWTYPDLEPITRVRRTRLF